MDNFQIQLRILVEMLGKKKSALMQILAITENQENILLSPHAATEEGAMFFTGLNDEKQRLIGLVLESDKLFQNLFDEIKDEFEIRAKDFTEDTQVLKDNIKEIVDLDLKIRIREEKNRMLIEKTKPKEKKPADAISKAYLLKQYEKNKNF